MRETFPKKINTLNQDIVQKITELGKNLNSKHTLDMEINIDKLSDYVIKSIKDLDQNRREKIELEKIKGRVKNNKNGYLKKSEGNKLVETCNSSLKNNVDQWQMILKFLQSIIFSLKQ